MIDDDSSINDEEYEAPEVEAEDDDDLGEWADKPDEPVQPGIPMERPEVVAPPVTEAEVPMPMPAQVSSGKPKSKHNTGSRDSHVRAAKKGAKKAKQKASKKKSAKKR